MILLKKEEFKIEGLSELEDALKELGKTANKQALKGMLTKAAAKFVVRARARAPFRKGGLRESIKVGTKLSRSQRSAARKAKENDIEIYAGPAGSAKSIAQEFGTIDHGPQPYMRPAWEESKMDMLSGIKSDLEIEVEKVRKKAAAKAERLARKLKKAGG